MFRLWHLWLIVFWINEDLCQEEFLHWKPLSDENSKQSLYLTEDDTHPILIDGSVSNQIIVKNTNRLPTAPKITLSCTVNTLQAKFVIQKARFCRKRSPTNNLDVLCHDAIVAATEPYAYDANGKNLWTLQFDPAKGMNASSAWDEEFRNLDRVDFSGLYYCELRNELGSLTSASLEIQDVGRPFKALTLQENPSLTLFRLDNITNAKVPLRIPCPGANIGELRWEDRYNVDPMLRWKLCIVNLDTSPSSCQAQVIKESALVPNTIFNHFDILDTGHLEIYSIKSRVNRKDVALICYDVMNPGKRFGIVHGGPPDSTHVIGVNITALISDDVTLEYDGEKVHNITIREGKRSVKYKLIPHFKGNVKNVNVMWYKDDNLLEDSDDDFKYHYVMGDDITKSTAGVYKMIMKHKTTNAELQFLWYVTVTSPPRLTETFDTLDFVMEASSWSTKIAFDSAQEIKLSVNGHELVTSSKEKLEEDWKLFKDVSKLPNTIPTVSPLRLKNVVQVTYMVSNVLLSDSHSITFEGVNNIGSARATKLLKVVPLPIFTETVKSANCTSNCYFDQKIVLRMVQDQQNKEKMQAMGLIIRQAWIINGQKVPIKKEERINEWKYVDLLDDGQGLSIGPVEDDDTEDAKRGRAMFGTSNVTFEFSIHDPENDNALYNSKLDNKFFATSGAVVLSIKQKPVDPGQAGFVWWWIILLLVLFLILLLIIGLWAVRNRHQPQATYDADKEEKQKGLDPDKELENDKFPDYQNEGEAEPIIKPSYVPQAQFAPSKGRINAVDDAESIDLDPNAFNEDGSFIYKYRNSGVRGFA